MWNLVVIHQLLSTALTSFLQDGTFRCDCRPGYQLAPDGRSCTTSLGCPGGCENGGQCFRGRCLCRSGFQGARCELDQNECSLPAASHGCTFQCLNTHGSYECICPPGYRRLDDKRTCVVSEFPLMFICVPQTGKSLKTILYAYWDNNEMLGQLHTYPSNRSTKRLTKGLTSQCGLFIHLNTLCVQWPR